MAETLRECVGFLDEEGREPCYALGGQTCGRSRDRKGGMGGPVASEDSGGHRRQADLELVDRRRVAARPHLGELLRTGIEGEEDLAVRGVLEVDPAADPVGDPDE